MKRSLIPFVCFLFVFGATTRLLALGREEFGNKPLDEPNYSRWPGLMSLINDKTRVYHSWVNGDSDFYYKGGTRELNIALKRFAAVQSKSRQVHFLPAPGNVQTFGGKIIQCNWTLGTNSGLENGILSKLDKGDLIWPNYTSPLLTIYVGDGIKIHELEIPEGLTLVSRTQLKMQCIDAIKGSSDLFVRAKGCGLLASLDPYDVESVKAIEAQLRDKDNGVHSDTLRFMGKPVKNEEHSKYVGSAAAGALAQFGNKAKTALATLRDAATKSDDKDLRDAANNAITTIETATETPEVERRFRTFRAEMEKFIESHQAKRK